jgi:hypothetical protein
MLNRTIRRHFTAAAPVQSQVISCEICGGHSSIGACVLRVIRFPLPILISLFFHKVAYTRYDTLVRRVYGPYLKSWTRAGEGVESGICPPPTRNH